MKNDENKRVIHIIHKTVINYFNPKKMTVRDGIRRAAILVCVTIFLVEGYIIAKKKYNDYIGQREYDNIVLNDTTPGNDEDFFSDNKEEDDVFIFVKPGDADITYLNKDPGNTAIANKILEDGRLVNVKYVDLYNRNNDMVGYVKIPDTKINYPVLLYRGDNEYYAKRNMDLKERSTACIFMDYRNRPYSEDQNTVIYGHNMDNGTMFGTLKDYKKQDFALKHKYIYFDTIYETMVWQVFTSFTTHKYEQYVKPSFKTEEEFMEFVNLYKSKSDFDYNIKVKPTDRILTLSTCGPIQRPDERFVVQAILISRTKK